MKHRTFTFISFIFIILFSFGCGFQGRKYTSGHFWDGRNAIEYEKQKENGNEVKNEKTKNRKLLLNEDRGYEVGKICDTNKIKAVKHGLENFEKCSKNPKLICSEVTDTVIPNEIPSKENNQNLNVEVTPIDIDAQKKALDDELLYTIALSAVLGGLLFFSLFLISFQIPELAPFSAILQLIVDVIWIKSTIQLNHTYKKLADALMPYKNENSNKKWYQKIVDSMNSDGFIRIVLILGYILFNYFFFSMLVQ